MKTCKKCKDGLCEKCKREKKKYKRWLSYTYDRDLKEEIEYYEKTGKILKRHYL